MKGRRGTAVQKRAIVVEGLKGERPRAKLCRQPEGDQSQYYRWRDRFLEGGQAAVENGEAPSRGKPWKARMRERERSGGTLTVQNEILERLTKLPMV